ncbi:Cytochrome c oxidase subunit 3 [Methylobacterium crusticola]|uniref:Cytochrome c oxidase subunit 3 n=1 Tax=Methylobacterium crusticola TaxID=1697972 RepID=A0ABQ4QSE0_9HYPH|nr:cytochrome c oxidase subunit 3 [Methylobacterium crusticola]GJD47874.1 Cytochrome c oxidase subunit 3 [Methylobacterium crusticola]
MSAGAEGAEGVGVALVSHFATVEQQRHAAVLGMWAWLLTELLLFAGLFLTALVLRLLHPEAVQEAARHLKFWIGALNTVVLITSSLTMSGAIQLSRLGWQRGMVRFMLATAALGTLFLAFKGYEYWADYHEHMMPFLGGRPYALESAPASRLFVNLYYVATSLHGLHLTTGIGILLAMTWQASRPGFLARHQNRIEIFGLYWHFIDLIWILAFPILYVVNR